MTQSTQTTGHLQPEQLNAFVDGELPVAEAQIVQAGILDACHGCTLRVLTATQLKTATARAGQRFAAPPETLARLAAQLRQPAPTPSGSNPPASQHSARIVPIRRAPATFTAAWSAIAATLLIAVSLFTWNQFHQAGTLAAELLDQHLAMLSGGAAPQVVSTDRHTVKPWFQGRLPFSFNLPDADALPPDTILRGRSIWSTFRARPRRCSSSPFTNTMFRFSSLRAMAAFASRPALRVPASPSAPPPRQSSASPPSATSIPPTSMRSLIR